MIKFATLLALVAAATASPISRFNLLKPNGRIIGGVDTSIDLIPYQVSLQVYGSHSCGGSIISDTWILTAAHCMIYPVSWFTVRSGSTISDDGGTVTSLAAAISHEGYDYNGWGVPSHDIAVIQLSSPLIFSSTQAPIGLYSSGQESIVGAPAVVSGWGAITVTGLSTVVLQSITIPIVSKADCNTALSLVGGLPVGQICAAVPEGGLDACLGDSGGPLAIDGVLAGVVSWGIGCAQAGFPGAYSEVAYYRTWITTHSGV